MFARSAFRATRQGFRNFSSVPAFAARNVNSKAALALGAATAGVLHDFCLLFLISFVEMPEIAYEETNAQLSISHSSCGLLLTTRSPSFTTLAPRL